MEVPLFKPRTVKSNAASDGSLIPFVLPLPLPLLAPFVAEECIAVLPLYGAPGMNKLVYRKIERIRKMILKSIYIFDVLIKEEGRKELRNRKHE